MELVSVPRKPGPLHLAPGFSVTTTKPPQRSPDTGGSAGLLWPNLGTWTSEGSRKRDSWPSTPLCLLRRGLWGSGNRSIGSARPCAFFGRLDSLQGIRVLACDLVVAKRGSGLTMLFKTLTGTSRGLKPPLQEVPGLSEATQLITAFGPTGAVTRDTRRAEASRGRNGGSGDAAPGKAASR